MDLARKLIFIFIPFARKQVLSIDSENLFRNQIGDTKTLHPILALKLHRIFDKLATTRLQFVRDRKRLNSGDFGEIFCCEQLTE